MTSAFNSEGKKGNRALPDDLPEWKYVNTDLQFWGIRHFDRTQAKLDPSSPFGGQKSANDADGQAIHLTKLSFAPTCLICTLMCTKRAPTARSR